MRSLRWIANAIRPPDVVHAPNYFLPAWARPGTGVATIHDLSVFRYPETHPAERIEAFDARFADTVARAALLVTDTEWNRRELIEFAGVPESRVRAVPLGVGADYHPRSMGELAAPLGRLGLAPGGYGLCVSTLEPRKRIDRVLAAWRLLPAALRARFPLVIAGSSGWRNEQLMQAIALGQAEGWVRFPGFLAEADLPLLYAGARMFAYPSVYEGFGLPPLEAMASGVPTLVASGTCLTEVTAGGALVVDVEDAEQFAQSVRTLLEDDAERRRLADTGRKVAAAYTWEACIAQTVEAYRTVSG